MLMPFFHAAEKASVGIISRDSFGSLKDGRALSIHANSACGRIVSQSLGCSPTKLLKRLNIGLHHLALSIALGVVDGGFVP